MQTVPVISDYLVIIFDVNLKCHIPREPIRKVFHFHKADEISLKMKAEAVFEKFINFDPAKNDINPNWYIYLSILQQ